MLCGCVTNGATCLRPQHWLKAELTSTKFSGFLTLYSSNNLYVSCWNKPWSFGEQGHQTWTDNINTGTLYATWAYFKILLQVLHGRLKGIIAVQENQTFSHTADF